MNGKKTLPLLVIATLMISLIPSVMFAHAAFAFTNFYTVVDGVEGGIVASGVKGDVVAAIGTGATSGTTIGIYWDNPNLAWNGVAGLLNSTTVKSSGNFDVWFTIPEATNGAHYLWFKDSGGSIYGPFIPVTGFVVNALVKLSPSSGLKSDTITVKMYGYKGSEKLNVTWAAVVAPIATATANSLGTASTTFKVPTDVTGTYAVTGSNSTDAITASANFVVGPVITLSATSGTVGQVITITGRGFTPGDTIAQGNVYIGDGGNVICYITSPTTLPMTVDATGRIRLNVVVPQMADTGDFVMYIVSAAGSAHADFTVSALAKVSITPGFAPVASSVTVSGVNYPKISGVEIQVYMNATKLGTVKTLADGTFSKVFKVPASGEGKATIDAYTTDPYNIDATTSFKVGTMNLILSDDSGPTGLTMSLTGNGLTHSGAWNATFGSKTIISSSTADSHGLISGTFQVPQLPVGTYTITVWDVVAEISMTAQFKITQTTSVTLSVPSAPNTFNVTLTGYGFSDGGDSVNFVIYNKTSTGAADFWTTMTVVNLPAGSGNVVTNSSSMFYGYWLVEAAPDVDLSKGNYFINATDTSANSYAVTVPFAVGDVHILAAPRKPSFAIGETISFNLEHSFGSVAPIWDSVLKIYDPNGTLIFFGDKLEGWTKTGLWYTCPYSSQTAGKNPMTLADDAVLGNWSWKWVDTNGDTVKTGTFAVTASAASVTDAAITALGQQLTDLKTQVTGITTQITSIQTAATAAQNTATAAQTSAAAAKTSADAATTAATAAGTAANAAVTAANAAKTSADNAAAGTSGLTTLVYAAIGASLVAALAAIVALMQISRKIA